MVRYTTILLLLVLLGIPHSAKADNVDDSDLDKVVLQLKWKHAFQFAGYYLAKEKGFYREAGLQVEIRESGPTIDPVQEVVTGRANFGVGDSSIVIERAEGNPIVVLGVVFQHSAIVLVALKTNSTQTIHDLASKRIMLVKSSHEIRAYLRKAGLPPESYTTLPNSFDIQDLVVGNTDAFSVYITDQPYTLEKLGIPYVSFSPRSAGIDFYGDNLFTSESEIQEDRRRVEKFRDASNRGWRYAMENIDESIDLIISKYSSARDRDSLRFEANQMVSLIQPRLIEMGYMHEGRWRHIVETYAEIGTMDSELSLESFIYQEEIVPVRNLGWLYRIIAIVIAGLLLVTYVALRFYRLSRALRADITARKKAEAEKAELESQLLHSKKIQAIGTLAGGMAHDMNNVLAVILGVGAVLLDDVGSDSPIAEDVQDIISAAERGQSMVTNLLGFARKGKYELAEWQPNAGVEGIVSMLGKMLPKTIVISTKLGAKSTLVCDSNQIISALMNLCVNAAHAIGDKGTIIISTEDREIARDASPSYQRDIAPGSYVALAVRDDGKGMDSETIKRAFEPFFTTKDIGEGTGLGLSMVHGVVESHKGKVNIDSCVGEGTTITILLPAG